MKLKLQIQYRPIKKYLTNDFFWWVISHCWCKVLGHFEPLEDRGSYLRCWRCNKVVQVKGWN